VSSKCDPYWQAQLDSVLALFDQTRTAGKSLPFDEAKWRIATELAACQNRFGAALTERFVVIHVTTGCKMGPVRQVDTCGAGCSTGL
jgi:hypothetical protein